jgi:hypothetical protein
MTERLMNVVLVHGAFADGSGWEPVAKILMNDLLVAGFRPSLIHR